MVITGGELSIMTIRKVNLKKIKSLRKAKGLSFSQMAEKLGYESQNGYYYLETGRNKFSAEALAMVATIFNVPIEDLFFEDKVTKLAN